MVRIFLLLILFQVSAFSQEFKVRAYTDTTYYMIGDHIKLHYVVEHDKGLSFAEPAFRDSINNIDIIGISSPIIEEQSKKIITRYDVTLSRYDSSDIRIPPIKFYYWKGEKKDRAEFLMDKFSEGDSTVKNAFSNEVLFRVDAVKVNVREDIKDIKQPVTIPPDWKLILLYILIGIVVIALAVYIYFVIKKRRDASAAIKKVHIPPHVAALGALNELEKKNLWQKGMIKEFHSEVTGIIRNYFEKRFGFPSLEITSGETLDLLNRTDGAKAVINDVEVFLNNADLVKFAKFVPMSDINEMMMKKAYLIVERTIPVNGKADEVPDVQ